MVVLSKETSSPSISTGTSSLVYQVTRDKIQEKVKEAAEYGFSGVEESLNNTELHTLTNRVIEFIAKINVGCPAPTAASVEELLEDASWCPVGDRWVLMFLHAMIGKGTESDVYRGILREGDECAVKYWKKTPTEEWQKKQNEFYALMSFSSHVLKRIAADENYGIEPLCKGNLHDIRNEDSAFVDSHIQEINEGVLQGLADIHSHGYVYSDLKLLNLLLSEKGTVMFGDFGDCYLTGSLPTKGTYGYWAPERIDYHLEVHKEGKEEQPLPYAQLGDIWQAMLVLADLNEERLSEPFRQRFEEYTAKQYDFALELQESGRELVKLGLEEQDLKLQGEKLVMKYVEASSAHLKDLREKRKGLFSDLIPETHLEKLLIQMSMFDPKDRISAAAAVAYLKSS